MSSVPVFKTLSDKEDLVFKLEGEHHDGIRSLVGRNSGMSFVYIEGSAKATASVCLVYKTDLFTTTKKAGMKHFFEHFMCTGDMADLSALLAKTLESQRETVGLSTELEEVRTRYMEKLNGKFEHDRFVYDVLSNAATRANSICYHMSGLPGEAAVFHNCILLNKQHLSLQNDALDVSKVIREDHAVINEAVKCLGSSEVSGVLERLTNLELVRHNHPSTISVIGANHVQDASGENMGNFKVNSDELLERIREVQGTMYSNRMTLVYHGPRDILSFENFKRSVATGFELSTVRHLDPKSDNCCLKPAIHNDYPSSSNNFMEVEQDNLNLCTHAFVSALPTSQEYLKYSIFLHLMDDAASRTLGNNVCDFQTIHEHFSELPMCKVLYNVPRFGTEGAIIGKLHESMASVSKEAFEIARSRAVERSTSWKSELNLTDILPDYIAAHPCGAVGIMRLFTNETALREMTYEDYMKVHGSIHRRFTQATSLHAVSSKFLNGGGAVPNVETPVDLMNIESREHPARPVMTWEADECIPGDKYHVALSVECKSEFMKDFVSHVALKYGNTCEGVKFDLMSSYGSMRIIASARSTKGALMNITGHLLEVLKQLRNPTDVAVDGTRMDISRKLQNPSFCLESKVTELLSGVINDSDVGQAEFGDNMAPKVQCVFFLPNKSTLSRSDIVDELTSCKSLVSAKCANFEKAFGESVFNESGDLRVSSVAPDVSNDLGVINTLQMSNCKSAPFMTAAMLPVANVGDALAADALAELCGGGWQSCAMRVIRRELNLTYGIYSRVCQSGTYGNTFRLQTQSIFAKDQMRPAATHGFEFIEDFYKRKSTICKKLEVTLDYLLDHKVDIEMSRGDMANYHIHQFFKLQDWGLSRGQYMDMLGDKASMRTAIDQMFAKLVDSNRCTVVVGE